MRDGSDRQVDRQRLSRGCTALFPHLRGGSYYATVKRKTDPTLGEYRAARSAVLEVK